MGLKPVGDAGADEINKAADAAEKVTSDVTKLVSELALGSQDGEAVEDAYEQRYECMERFEHSMTATIQASTHHSWEPGGYCSTLTLHSFS